MMDNVAPFTEAIVAFCLRSISKSHYEGSKTRFSFLVSLSFYSAKYLILMLLNCRIVQEETCIQRIIYHDLQSFLCHCFPEERDILR